MTVLTAYHGTRFKFKNFDILKAQSNGYWTYSFGKSIYFSTTRNDALSYCDIRNHPDTHSKVEDSISLDFNNFVKKVGNEPQLLEVEIDLASASIVKADFPSMDYIGHDILIDDKAFKRFASNDRHEIFSNVMTPETNHIMVRDLSRVKIKKRIRYSEYKINIGDCINWVEQYC